MAPIDYKSDSTGLLVTTPAILAHTPQIHPLPHGALTVTVFPIIEPEVPTTFLFACFLCQSLGSCTFQGIQNKQELDHF